MRTEKRIADLLTSSRALIGLGLIGLGFIHGEKALAWVAWLMLANWAGDVLDGAVARLSPVREHSWIGDHDLEVDIFVATGLAIYLWQAEFILIEHLVLYFVLWLVIFLVFGYRRPLGMLFQAPIYVYLIVITLGRYPFSGWAMLVGIMALIFFTWPRFPNQVIPDFLNGIRTTLNKFSGQ